MWARLRWIKADTENALLISSNGNGGVGLVMWAIRTYPLGTGRRSDGRLGPANTCVCVIIGWGCYIAESGIAFFWAFSLAQAVYGWRDDIRFYRPLVVISEAGKAFPALAAVLTMALLQLDTLQESFWWFSFVMNLFCQSS